MANERLRRAIAQAGLTLVQVAEHVEVDPKTIERWITKGRLPHPRHRAATAAALDAEEIYLWPEAADSPEARSASVAELIRLYPHRGAVPSGYWYELIQRAKEHVDVLVYSGLFLPDGHADLGRMLAEKASEGVQVRLLMGNPKSDAVLRRGEEEGIGDHLAARCQLSKGYLKAAFGAPGVSIREHSTTLYNSIYRFDDELLVNAHAYGAPAGDSPVMHLRHTPGGRLFDHYMRSFDRVWATSRAARKPAARARVVR